MKVTVTRGASYDTAFFFFLCCRRDESKRVKTNQKSISTCAVEWRPKRFFFVFFYCLFFYSLPRSSASRSPDLDCSGGRNDEVVVHRGPEVLPQRVLQLRVLFLLSRTQANGNEGTGSAPAKKQKNNNNNNNEQALDTTNTTDTHNNSTMRINA